MQKDQQIRVTASQTGRLYIVVSEAGVDEDGVITTRRGMLEMNGEDKANALAEKLQKGERTVVLGGRPNQQGLYQANLLKISPGVAAATAITEGQSIAHEVDA